MKRFHVHLHVDDLAQSVGFYTRLFAAEPVRLEADYAKWMLDDPRLNFAISTHGQGHGVDHLGFQAEDEGELAELKARAESTDRAILNEGATVCCYARSEKHWVTDPQGIAWEHYRTLERAEGYGEARPAASAQEGGGACCTGAAPRGKPLAVPVKSASSCC
ncbi:ArsI/CadI family heavy metal resistance metalloenzyme [Variovorax sp. RA8]|uniref:ArsI/CadI family heavy metal resistance metalloenzyme n=1 Tax=Variovorax sp. (strain JCM 16519 / RA8) TaxID=662548 RepID=UPI0013192ED8|nr:ArsI/CadI family heavy metal resistance metalloenzyme [Variovorax sp. RA8]VTU36022.1 Cadmium-induced protein CadI [Variovorax sp. RA8]